MSRSAVLGVVMTVVAPAALAQVSMSGTTTTAVHTAAGAGVVLNSPDFYGSGNDDSFAEFGVTTFRFSNADFGFEVTDITSATLALTVNDRSFSDGDAVEVFFTPDTADELGGDFADLSYDLGFTNGIDPTQFVTAPVSLGVYAITEMTGRAGGEVDTFDLSFAGAALVDLIAQINNDSDFQIIIGSTDASHDITYSGVGNDFDPGDPVLTLNAVPGPAGGSVFLAGGLALARRRR